MKPKRAPPPPLPLQMALSRWDGEGGAGPDGPQTEPAAAARAVPVEKSPAGELDLLHARVIALENLVISLLANSSGPQLEPARQMAACIAPHPGATRHPLTIAAAARMIDLVARAARFRGGKIS